MRWLIAATVVMGVMIVVGTGVVVATIVKRAGSGPAKESAIALDEPAGTHIAGVSGAGDVLAVRLEGGGPDRVVVIDLRTMRPAARVGLVR